MSTFKVYPDAETVARAAADYLQQQITQCVTERGQCHVVLPGGSTPARCLELLAKQSLPWKNIFWYPGDERCYPVGSAERNDTMIRNKLFLQQEIHGEKYIENLRPIPAELGPEQGAEKYAAILDSIQLDIAVLGMGEDGHTASLFPGNPALDNNHSAVPVYNAPKAPLERISIGLQALKNASERIVIATGANKREALTKIQQGTKLPVAMIEPDVWFLDEAAAAVMGVA